MGKKLKGIKLKVSSNSFLISRFDINFADSCIVSNFTSPTICGYTEMEHITPTPCFAEATTITVISDGEGNCTNNYTEPSSAILCTVVSTLVGLLVILLVVVTTGWVWTCWTMKKRKVKSTHEK